MTCFEAKQGFICQILYSASNQLSIAHSSACYDLATVIFTLEQAPLTGGCFGGVNMSAKNYTRRPAFLLYRRFGDLTSTMLTEPKLLNFLKGKIFTAINVLVEVIDSLKVNITICG